MPQRKSTMTPRRLFQDENPGNENENENQINYNDDNAANVFLEELTKSREEAKQKWNFDFVNEKPLEGVWEWEKVEETAPNLNSKESQENNQNTTNTQGCA